MISSEQQTTHILLISSVASQRADIGQVFPPPQYQIKRIAAWRDAIHWIACQCPDLIVLDTAVPELELGSTCQMLRAAASHPHLPILMILALDGAITPAIAFAQGATDYLTSPLIPAELVARLRPYLHKAAVANDRVDQRPQAEQALQDRERQNRALLSALPDLIIRLRGDGQYLDFRPTSALHVFGDSSRIGCSVYDSGLPIELIEQRMTFVRKALQTGEIQIYEQQIEIEGLLRTEEVRIVVCAENEVLLVVRDVTARKQAEQQLRDSQAFLDAVIDAIADLIFVKDEQHRFVLANPAVAEFAGVPKEALIGKSDYDFFPTEQAELFWHQDEIVLSQGQEQIVEEQLTHATLGLRVLNTRKTWLADASGHRFLVGYSRDITDQKIAEEALRQSEERWQLAIEGTEDGIWDWDIPTKQMFWSRRWKTMLGYDEHELPGDAYRWFWQHGLHPDDRDRVWNAQQRYLSRQTPNYAIEYRLRCKHGLYKWILSRGKAVWNEQGEAIRMVGSNTDISLSKQAEAELQQLNEDLEQRVQQRTQALQRQTYLLQTILNNMGDGILVTNTSGAILLRNPAAEKIAELSVLPSYLAASTDRLPMYLPDGITPCPLDQLPLMRAMRGESADQVEIIIRDPVAGSDMHIEATVRPLTDGAGTLLGGVAVIRDVTARKQAEKTLHDQEERLRLALESANLGAWEWDLMSGHETWSSQSEALFGFAPGSFDGSTETFLDRIVPPDRERVQQSLLQAIRTGSYRVEYRVAHPNGSIRWFASLGKIFYNAVDEPIRLLGLHMDLTEQKDAEAALRDSEERLRLALIAADQGLYDLNLQTGEAIVTPEYATMLGYDPADFHETNAKWIERLHPDDREPVAQVYRDYVAGRIPEYKVEFRQRTKAGHWKWILSLGKIVAWDAEGQPLRMLGTHTDIGDRKKVEQTLKDMNLELERRVETRTADLRQAVEAAEAANRAKSTFLANMSHELRTPLNAILGFSQLMSRSRALTPEQHEQIGIINRSGEHLLTLINDILEMSKIEAGRITLNSLAFDLPQLINTLTEMFRLRAERKGLPLIIEVAADVPLVVETDGSKLRQVLINLLSNAVKFTAQGQVTLRVTRNQDLVTHRDQRTTPQSDDLNRYVCRLCFEVEDTGSGIAPNEFGLLFEPFAQTRTGQQTQEGTGLGLPISQAFVRLLGGDLEVSSVVNQGSIFRFTIPVKPSDRAIASTIPQHRRVLGLAPGQPPYRILVVEDNEANRKLLLALFTSLTLEVEAVENGQQAVWMWQHWQPHLIWMDMRMPVLDGYQATQQIRALEAQAQVDSTGAIAAPPSRTIIIALTANAFEEQRTAMIDAGCDDFVHKPFHDSTLLDKMVQHLGIQFVYAEAIAPTENRAIVPTNALRADQCVLMPHAWMLQLYEAAVGLNCERIITLLQDVPDEHTALAQSLIEKVDNFDFEEIVLFAQHCLAQPRQSS